MDINFTEQLKAVLELSRQEAVRHNNAIITPEHMFLAILGDTMPTSCASSWTTGFTTPHRRISGERLPPATSATV